MNPAIKAAAQSLRMAPIDLVSTYELSLYLRCDRKTIERMVKRRILAPLRVGRNFRFSRAEVVERLSSAA